MLYAHSRRTSAVRLVLLGAAIGLAVAWPVGRLAACPFCTAQSLTLSEEINANQIAVLARLDELPSSDVADPVAAKARFEVVEVLKGGEHVKAGQRLDVLYFGQDETGTMCYLIGNDAPDINWSTPVPLTSRAVGYLRKLPSLPEKGADRLAFFQEYFEDPEELLARDAYDEFARAPYSEVQELRGRMHHDKLVAWIRDPQVPASRRRLYLTMLGICGTPEDLPMLEEMIKSTDRETKRALDALVACYLTLKGEAGLPLVEELFLKNADAEYVDTYATIQALRFLGQEQSHLIPRERLAAAMRHMLDRPELADLVIPDLARWEDWSVMPQLVELFKKSDEDSSWVRVPVINYLRACPLPEAKEHLDELAKLDPDAMKRANSFFPFAAAAPPPDVAARPPAQAADQQAESGDSAAEINPPEPTESLTDSEAPAEMRAADASPTLNEGGSTQAEGATAASTAGSQQPSDQPASPQPSQSPAADASEDAETAVAAATPGDGSDGGAAEDAAPGAAAPSGDPGQPAGESPMIAPLVAAAIVLAALLVLAVVVRFVLRGNRRGQAAA